MKLLIKSALILTVALLLSGYPGIWDDQIMQVKKTTVKILSVGSDTHWISSWHMDEAIKLGEFVEKYNSVAYKQGPSQDALCQELKKAAVVAIEQREKTFYGLYDVTCKPDRTGLAPRLEMDIWPQTFYGYRFKLTFEQTP